MKKIFVSTIFSLAVASTAQAQSTAKAGLDQLKKNHDNSVANLQDYKKNLKIADQNVSEVSKARTQVETQEKEVNQSAAENQKGLQTVEAREQELSKLIEEEQKQIQAEEAQLKQLEDMAAKVKENQKKRQANIANYQEQLKVVSAERKEWKSRNDQVAKSQQQIQARKTALLNQETEWKNKKRGYEGEVSRWQKESDRQKKLVDTYSALSDQ